MRLIVISAALSALASAPAGATIVTSAPSGFHLRQTVTLNASPADAFAKFAHVANWWNADHTYGGSASALSISLTPGGCFCERLANGGVEHMRVVYVDSGKRLVMTGGLGPLLSEAVAGVMDVKFEANGTGAVVTLDYKAAGFARGGADKLAPLVDRVLEEQLKRFAAPAPAD